MHDEAVALKELRAKHGEQILATDWVHEVEEIIFEKGFDGAPEDLTALRIAVEDGSDVVAEEGAGGWVASSVA